MTSMPVAGVVGGLLLALFSLSWIMFCVFWWLPRVKRWLERRLGETLTTSRSGSWTIERGVGEVPKRHSAVKWLLLELLVTGVEFGFFIGMVLVWSGVMLGGWLLLRQLS